MDIKTLSEQYAKYDQRKRLEAVFRDFERVLITSSFGTTSAILLHMLAKIKPEHPVYFIDTGYLFRGTHMYKDQLASLWNLNVVSIHPKRNEHDFTRVDYTWMYEPDSCCFVNKVMPLDKLKAEHDVWISGMTGGTTDHRKSLNVFKASNDILRFQPLIDMSPEEADWYRVIHELPEHPLEAAGYGSVGCVQCTQKGEGRAGRWVGFNKTECGLHTYSG